MLQIPDLKVKLGRLLLRASTPRLHPALVFDPRCHSKPTLLHVRLFHESTISPKYNSHSQSLCIASVTYTTIPSFRVALSGSALPNSGTRMASDEDYNNFLDKANEDTGTSKSSGIAADAKRVNTKAVDTDVPADLQKIEIYYTSDADEPFEPVSLLWQGAAMPSEREFGKLVGHKGEVSIINVAEFDPRGQYKKVLDAVKKAGDGEAMIFRIAHGATRAELFAVGLGDGKIVGMKVLAVES